jgi:hypothetical protein
MHKYVHTYRWLTPLQRAWIFHCTESMRTIYSSMYVFTGKQVKICSVCTVCMKTFNLSVCMYVWMILCVFLTSSISMFACWLYVCIMSVFELYVCMYVCTYAYHWLVLFCTYLADYSRFSTIPASGLVKIEASERPRILLIFCIHTYTHTYIHKIKYVCKSK